MCDTGLKLNQEGKGVEVLKHMVINGELAIVEKEDRELYNTLPLVLRIPFDECKVSMEKIKKWFTDGKAFDPNFASG